jgi:DNA helicase HerA-like ATPase
MLRDNRILVGKSQDKDLEILLNKANRHGLITGASGSGKTITLKVMAESFSDAGVPVFLADVKGDLEATALAGESNENLEERLKKLKINDFEYKGFPVRYWDIFGTYGHPIRTTLDSVGPEILSMMLGLSEAQEGVLAIVYRIANENGWKLDDVKDLRLLLQYVGDNKNDFITKYGNITAQSVGVIQRCLLTLENQGADKFFGQPELDINDFLSFDTNGKGTINILHAVELFQSPDLYASFLLWLLTNLFNKMPEVGDLEKPRIVFFFDEAHLLFNGMPTYRLKQIVQVVKLIRSRGIGLYFISQSPTDIPDDVIAQLGNRVQHTLRAYTPSEQKTVKVAADAFRTNPKFDTAEAILALGTGEALISFQNEAGEPEVVEKATILPPQSKMGVIDEITRNKTVNSSPLIGKYDEAQERDSAFEELDKMIKEKIAAEEEEKRKIAEEKEAEKAAKEAEKAAKEAERDKKAAEREAEKKRKEAERAKKNTIEYKLGRKVANKTADKLINKGLNTIFKKLF